MLSCIRSGILPGWPCLMIVRDDRTAWHVSSDVEPRWPKRRGTSRPTLNRDGRTAWNCDGYVSSDGCSQWPLCVARLVRRGTWPHRVVASHQSLIHSDYAAWYVRRMWIRNWRSELLRLTRRIYVMIAPTCCFSSADFCRRRTLWYVTFVVHSGCTAWHVSSEVKLHHWVASCSTWNRDGRTAWVRLLRRLIAMAGPRGPSVWCRFAMAAQGASV